MEAAKCLPPFDKLTEEVSVIDEILSTVCFNPQKSFDGKTKELADQVDHGDGKAKSSVTVGHDKIMGRCLIAERDIDPGEVFLDDWPLVAAPNAGESGVTCLGCGLISTNLHPCPSCGWPVCSAQCSSNPQHAEFECKIFSRESIKPQLPSPYSFIASAEYIKILRCLLLKDETNPEKIAKWKQVLSLEAHMAIRRNIPRVQLMAGLIKRFIKNLCKLDHFEGDTIEYVLGVIDVNAFRHSFAPAPLKLSCTEIKDPHRNATFLYPIASMAAHGCVRNTDWKTLAGGQLEMRASHKIFKGEMIYHAYVDLMLGTPERRRLLRDLFYFDCSCARCSDRTEINTYFSALKCTECATGYLLAEDPLEYKSNWVCNHPNCNGSKTHQHERELAQQILNEEKNICDQIPVNSNIATVKALTKVLKKHRGVTVHPNHYRLVNLEYILVRHLLKIPKPPVEIKLEMKRLIKKYMRLSSVFHPCHDQDLD